MKYFIATVLGGGGGGGWELCTFLGGGVPPLKKLVNHSPAARDLQAFLVSPNIPRGFITPINS